MPMRQILKEQDRKLSKVELADSHCHLDVFKDIAPVREAVEGGVLTIITDGVDTKSNARALELSDGRNIFAALGIDPEHAAALGDVELDFNIDMMRANSRKIVAIGEIGLDFMIAKSEKAKAAQRKVFGGMLDLAGELGLPVSVHARESMDEVLATLKARKVKLAHLHFFSGTEQQAEEAAELGYMVSIPPLQSSSRRRAIMRVPLQQLLAETDCPIVGKTPADVEKSVRLIAEAKGIVYEEAAKAIVENTKRFFSIHDKLNKQKSPLIRY